MPSNHSCIATLISDDPTGSNGSFAAESKYCCHIPRNLPYMESIDGCPTFDAELKTFLGFAAGEEYESPTLGGREGSWRLCS